MLPRSRSLLVFSLLVFLCLGDKTDYYAVLGLKKDATAADIKKAYRALAQTLHPDKNKGDAAANERFSQVQIAYEILSDPDQRLLYNDFGENAEYHTSWQYEEAKKKGLAKSTGGFYVGNEFVVTLTTSNFDRHVGKKDAFMVEFYAPWCVHCQKMTKEWKKAAVWAEGVMKVGAVNCEKESQLCNQRFGIQQFPTIMFFSAGDNTSPDPYMGEHTAEAFLAFAKESTQSYVETLTKDNFSSLVLESEDVWLVDFQAPWCGPCRQLKPALRRAASALRGRVRFGIVDCQAYQNFCGTQQLQYYPLLRLYRGGRENKGSHVDLTEMNQMAAPYLATFEKTALALLAPPPATEQPQATSHDENPHMESESHEDFADNSHQDL